MNFLISIFKNDIKLLLRKGLLSSFILLTIYCSQSIKLEGQFFFLHYFCYSCKKKQSMEESADTWTQNQTLLPGVTFHLVIT